MMLRKSKSEKVSEETAAALRKSFRRESTERREKIKGTVRQHLERRFGQEAKAGPEMSAGFIEYGSSDLYRQVLSDIRFRIEQQIAERDSVATRWTVFGIYDPTKTPVTIEGVTITTVKDDEIASDRSVWDASQLLKQVGGLPER